MAIIMYKALQDMFNQGCILRFGLQGDLLKSLGVARSTRAPSTTRHVATGLLCSHFCLHIPLQCSKAKLTYTSASRSL
jgi:hypothetical protein